MSGSGGNVCEIALHMTQWNLTVYMDQLGLWNLKYHWRMETRPAAKLPVF